MGDQRVEAWERIAGIVERNRAAETLQRRVHLTPEQRAYAADDGGTVDKLRGEVKSLRRELAEQKAYNDLLEARQVKFEEGLTWMQKAIGSLSLDVAALNGADSEVVRPGGIDRPTEYVPAEYASKQ